MRGLLSCNIQCSRLYSHLPTHSSREILIIFGSLTTCDPGNIHDTLDACVKDRIRISVVALAAEMKICRELCDKTGGMFSYHVYCSSLLMINVRSIRCCIERRTLQGPSFRTCTSPCPTRFIPRFRCYTLQFQPTRRSHANGIPHSTS